MMMMILKLNLTPTPIFPTRNQSLHVRKMDQDGTLSGGERKMKCIFQEKKLKTTTTTTDRPYPPPPTNNANSIN